VLGSVPLNYVHLDMMRRLQGPLLLVGLVSSPLAGRAV
jgi:hypothetical protein